MAILCCHSSATERGFLILSLLRCTFPDGHHCQRLNIDSLPGKWLLNRCLLIIIAGDGIVQTAQRQQCPCLGTQLVGYERMSSNRLVLSYVTAVLPRRQLLKRRYHNRLSWRRLLRLPIWISGDVLLVAVVLHRRALWYDMRQSRQKSNWHVTDTQRPRSCAELVLDGPRHRGHFVNVSPPYNFAAS